MRKRVALFVIGLMVSAVHTLIFVVQVYYITNLFFRSGGHVWIETYTLSGEQWISFNTEGMSFHVPAMGFGISAAAFVLFSICLTLLIIEMTRARSQIHSSL